MQLNKAVSAIEREGAILVYPIRNQREPHSLWYEFFPRTKMEWEWTDESDSRVADLWHLREQLARSERVVYAKWYQGRATFFSRECFTLLLAALRAPTYEPSGRALACLRTLEESSPQSAKALKQDLGFIGGKSDPDFQRTLKELWARLLIVGYGEIDDGAFPSLAIGASSLLFSDLFAAARKLSPEVAYKKLCSKLPEKFFLQLNRLEKPGKKKSSDPKPAEKAPAKRPKVLKFDDL